MTGGYEKRISCLVMSARARDEDKSESDGAAFNRWTLDSPVNVVEGLLRSATITKQPLPFRRLECETLP